MQKGTPLNGMNLSRNVLSWQGVAEFSPGLLHDRVLLGMTFADPRLDSVGTAGIDQDLAHVAARRGVEQPAERIHESNAVRLYQMTA